MSVSVSLKVARAKKRPPVLDQSAPDKSLSYTIMIPVSTDFSEDDLTNRVRINKKLICLRVKKLTGEFL